MGIIPIPFLNAMNILVVDDAAEIRAYLKGVLSNMSCTLYEACNGDAACELIEENKIDIVLTDWMMPGMNGIELIHWIRQRNSENYIYTILLTSRDRESDLVHGLSSGADDFMNKPVNANVLHARLKVAERIHTIQQNLLTQQHLLQESRDLLNNAFSSVKDDLEHAARVQRSLLPQSGKMMDVLSTAWRYRPAMGISGDHFDIYAIDNNKLVFYLLDVSGHGVTAALRSAAISQMLRPVSGFLHDISDAGPARILERLNQHLVRDNIDIDYLATIVLGVLDTENGVLKIANAGHPAALLVGADGYLDEISEYAGLPLSIDSNASYSDNTVNLQPGSTLVLHSDGLTDCENERGERFGFAALKDCVANNALNKVDKLVTAIETSIDNWRGKTSITDDQSILVIRYDEKARQKHSDLPMARQGGFS